MVVMRVFVLAFLFFAAGCAIDEGAPSICDEDPSNPNWPYCGAAEPGGYNPADDEIIRPY